MSLLNRWFTNIITFPRSLLTLYMMDDILGNLKDMRFGHLSQLQVYMRMCYQALSTCVSIHPLVHICWASKYLKSVSKEPFNVLTKCKWMANISIRYCFNLWWKVPCTLSPRRHSLAYTGWESIKPRNNYPLFSFLIAQPIYI